MAYAVADLRSYLTGPWMLARVVRDRRAGACGSFVGWASFQARDGELDYSEKGEMLFGGYRGVSFRNYRYCFPAANLAEVSFDDGRPFHSLDLTEGTSSALHHCGDDVYSGQFDARCNDLWDSQWHVTGPRKDLVISNRYIRGCGIA